MTLLLQPHYAGAPLGIDKVPSLALLLMTLIAIWHKERGAKNQFATL
jgi:hypothetical protein